MKTTLLHNMAVFINGDYKVGTADVTLPTFKVKTITKHFPGTAGEVEIPLASHEVLTLQINSADIYPDVLAGLGACDKPQMVHIRSIEKDVMNCDKENHVIEAVGIFTEVNLGTHKVGDENSRSYNLSCRQFKYEIDGGLIKHYDALAPADEDRAMLGL